MSGVDDRAWNNLLSDEKKQLLRFDATMHESMKIVRRFMVPLPDGVKPYLERLVLSEREPDGGKVYLHVIYESDGDRDCHDHPFDFQSTIIHGSYKEHTFARACNSKPCIEKGGRFITDGDEYTCRHCGGPLAADQYRMTGVYGPGRVNSKQAHQLHRLTIIEGPVVTLVKRGPKIRDWGFQTPEGWEHHASYIARKFPGAQPTEVD